MVRVPGRPILPGFCLRTGKLETVESKEAVPTDFCFLSLFLAVTVGEGNLI